MTFSRRLRVYIFGFLIGCALVALFFKGRLSSFTSWLPGNRVLELLRLSEAEYTPEALCQLECFGLDTADVSRIITDGRVKFSLSSTRVEPKKYVVDEEIDEQNVRVIFTSADSVATLISVDLPEELTDCPCGKDE